MSERQPTLRCSSIGLPRAFYYHMFPGLWKTFFEGLGLKTVTSRPSSRETVETAVRISEAEHCLPNKLFDAHLAELGDCVDVVFVPRVLSTVRGHIACPKLGALPDTARVHLADARAELLTADIDETRVPLATTLADLGKRLGVGRRQTKLAIGNALEAWNAAKAEASRPRDRDDRSSILVIGHPYALRDAFIARPVLDKLKKLDVRVDLIGFHDAEVPESFIKWDTCNKMHHRLQTLSRDACSGVIQITVFNCGCDSMTIDVFRRIMQKKRMPYMVLMMDEHFAQGGLETRLEAFVDSLQWQVESPHAR